MENPLRISRLESIINRRKSNSNEFSVDKEKIPVPVSSASRDSNSIHPPCTRFSPIEIASMVMILLLGLFALTQYPKLELEESIRSELLWRTSSFEALKSAAEENRDCESAYVFGLRYIMGINGSFRNLSLGKDHVQKAFNQCSCVHPPPQLFNSDNNYPSFMFNCRKGSS